VRLRGERTTGSGDGKVAVKGDFTTSQSGDAFSPAGGLAVRVADARAFDARFDWTAAECRARGRRVTCRSADGRRRLTVTSRSGGVWRFAASIARVAMTAPFAEPVAVTLSHTPAIDRRGTITGCAATQTALNCRAP